MRVGGAIWEAVALRNLVHPRRVRLLAAGAALLLGALGAATPAWVLPWPKFGGSKGEPHDRLAEAARFAPVKDVDYDQDRCDERTVEQWIADLVAPQALGIAWTSGRCQIVGPGI